MVLYLVPLPFLARACAEGCIYVPAHPWDLGCFGPRIFGTLGLTGLGLMGLVGLGFWVCAGRSGCPGALARALTMHARARSDAQGQTHQTFSSSQKGCTGGACADRALLGKVLTSGPSFHKLVENHFSKHFKVPRRGCTSSAVSGGVLLEEVPSPNHLPTSWPMIIFQNISKFRKGDTSDQQFQVVICLRKCPPQNIPWHAGR